MSEQILKTLVDNINRLKERVSHLERLEAIMGNYGWDGSAWRKDPIRLGYSDVVRFSVSNTNLAAGGNFLTSGAVPAGEIWIITNIAIRYVGTVTGASMAAAIRSSGTDHILYRQLTLESGVTYDRQGQWVLKPGEEMELIVFGATAGDDAYFVVTGQRVDIDQ